VTKDLAVLIGFKGNRVSRLLFIGPPCIERVFVNVLFRVRRVVFLLHSIFGVFLQALLMAEQRDRVTEWKHRRNQDCIIERRVAMADPGIYQNWGGLKGRGSGGGCSPPILA